MSLTDPSSGPSFSGPHSGYHWRGQTARFFEGWYFRLTLPAPDAASGQTFAFMYSIDDPAGGTDYSGGVAQILGSDETYFCRTFPDVTQFWASPTQLALGHWRRSADPGPARCLSGDTFSQVVQEGYQASARRHQGRLLGPSGDVVAEWDYRILPVARWGTPRPKATAGLLSYLPIFEPGWQILMAHGLATGWVVWQGQRYTFEDAPAYAEKNWGGAFPAKWFWLQCNAFAEEPTLSVTAAAGVREVLTWKENVGLIGIHHEGQFYEFFSTKMPFTWQVDPWGYWQLTAEGKALQGDRLARSYRVELIGRAADEGAWVRVPTRAGMKFLCRDTTHGDLQLRLWERSDPFSGSSNERLLLDVSSQLAGLEVGGGPWEDRWVHGK